METTYVGQMQVIRHDGRIFAVNDHSKQAVSDINWANRVLSEPAVKYQNGRNSHEVAGTVIDIAEDVLIDHLLITA